MSRIFTEDQLLIDRLGINDTEAFEELYRRYWYGLYAYCLKKLQSHQDAKAIVRDIFVQLWNNRESLPESFSFSRHGYEEVRKQVVKCLSRRLAEGNNLPDMEDRLAFEFSTQFLKGASERVALQTQAQNQKQAQPAMGKVKEAANHHPYTLSNLKWILHSLTSKISIPNILSYPKN